MFPSRPWDEWKPGHPSSVSGPRDATLSVPLSHGELLRLSLRLFYLSRSLAQLLLR